MEYFVLSLIHPFIHFYDIKVDLILKEINLFFISTVSNGRKCYKLIFSQYSDLKTAYAHFLSF